MTFAVVTAAALPNREVTPQQALGDLPLIEGLWNAPMIDPVYWTLAVEGLFYVLVATLFFTGALRGRRAVISLVAWLVVSVAVTTAGRAAGWGGVWAGLLTAVQWMPLFVLGMGFFLLRIQGRRRTGAGLVLGACVSACLCDTDPRLPIVLCALCMLLTVALWGPELILGNRVLVFLGEISYPLYLVHQNVGYVILLGAIGLGVSRIGASGLAVLVVIVAASVLTFLVDRPLRRTLRRRLLRTDTVE